MRYFLVEPAVPGAEGLEALARLEKRVQSIPGAQAQTPRGPPGVLRPPTRLRISVPSSAVAELQSEFGDALTFETDAELRY
jgi:hypothetical protein